MEQRPKLLFEAELKRNKYFKRFMWMILATVAAGAAWIALDEVAGRDAADANLLTIGKWVALIAFVLLVLRALLNLFNYFRVRSESLMVFDRGFVWKRGKKQRKYGWNQVKSFKEGSLIRQHGTHVIITRDGQTFKFRSRLGNPQAFADAVRPMIAETTAEAMTRAMREARSVRLHPQLAFNSVGVIAGKSKIHWSQVDVKIKRNKLSVCKRDSEGNFRTVKFYDIHSIDNLHGFMDVAESAMRTHQPQRFNIKTKI